MQYFFHTAGFTFSPTSPIGPSSPGGPTRPFGPSGPSSPRGPGTPSSPCSPQDRGTIVIICNILQITSNKVKLLFNETCISYPLALAAKISLDSREAILSLGTQRATRKANTQSKERHFNVTLQLGETSLSKRPLINLDLRDALKEQWSVEWNSLTFSPLWPFNPRIP